MSLTTNEAKVLRAIATNCFNVCNYGVPESYEEANGGCWTHSINDAGFPSGVEGRSLSGVLGSLNKKGFVKSFEAGEDSTVDMTREGWDAMMAYFNNDLTKEV